MVIRMGQEADPAKRIRQRQGASIKQVRLLRDIDRATLAATVGVTVSALTQWENGVTAPRQLHQVAIALALNVPHAVLFNLDGLAA